MTPASCTSVLLLVLCAGASAAAQAPPPLTLAAAVERAIGRRDEIAAARARTQAAAERPAIVSALEDPMISPAIDHLPFMFGGADVSVTIEQRIPLSGVRAHRRTSALADVDRLRADVRRTALDVGLEAASAFLMLQERRRMAALVMEQASIARDLVAAANARYAAGAGLQSDVLRAEVEVARLDAASRVLIEEARAAEAMLNAALAEPPDAPVPALEPLVIEGPIPSWDQIKAALAQRPELAAGRAEIARADAEVQIMRDMFRPMMTIRTGPSYTMTGGRGWMAMVGVSLPIWRGKLRAGVAEAQAMKAMSEADLRAMTRMIEGDAAVALGALRAAQARHLAYRDDVVPRARAAIEPALTSFAAGRLPLVGVIEAIQALWAVQADLIAAEAGVGAAWARVGRAMGSLEEIPQ